VTRVEVVRQIMGRFNDGRYDAIPELLHPDVEIAAQSSRFAGEPLRGYDGYRAWIAENLESFGEWSVSLDEVEERAGDRVLAVGFVHVRGRESGATDDVRCAWIFDFDGELARRMETFPNRVAEARSAAAELAP
jgi:ketosteroid isomerase-like protein